AEERSTLGRAAARTPSTGRATGDRLLRVRRRCRRPRRRRRPRASGVRYSKSAPPRPGTPSIAGRKLAPVVPCAYLRVYQRVDAFPTHQRAAWEKYLDDDRRAPVRPRWVDRQTASGLGLLCLAGDEQAD